MPLFGTPHGCGPSQLPPLLCPQHPSWLMGRSKRRAPQGEDLERAQSCTPTSGTPPASPPPFQTPPLHISLGTRSPAGSVTPTREGGGGWGGGGGGRGIAPTPGAEPTTQRWQDGRTDGQTDRRPQVSARSGAKVLLCLRSAQGFSQTPKRSQPPRAGGGRAPGGLRTHACAIGSRRERADTAGSQGLRNGASSPGSV